MIAQPQLSRRGEAYGVEALDVDGMDLVSMYQASAGAVHRARGGGGPTLLVADTYRYLGHMAGDTEIYRSASEVEDWSLKDPIELLCTRLADAGLLDPEMLCRLEKEISDEVAAAEQVARMSPHPAIELAFQDVAAGSEVRQ